MFNDFRGFDEQAEPVAISIPPTLLISSIGIMEDVTRAVTLDVKAAGDVVYVLGETRDELGGSEYLATMGEEAGGRVPQVDALTNRARYEVLSRAMREGLVASCISVTRGGLVVALAKMAMAGRLGLTVDLEALAGVGAGAGWAGAGDSGTLDPEALLFSESQGRLVVSVAPQHASAFERTLAGQIVARVGSVTARPQLVITSGGGGALVDASLDVLTQAYRRPMEGF